MNLPKTELTNEMTLLDMMWYPKGWTTLKPIEVVISSGLGEKSLVKQITWSTFQTAIEYLIHQAEIKARIAMVNQLFDGWIDYETNAKWKYMSIKHRNQIIEALEKEIVE